MQTEYNSNLDQLMLGAVTPFSVTEQITLIANAETVFGSLIKRDATGEIGVIVDGSTDIPVGIVKHEHNDKGLMVEGEALGVLTKGAIPVTTEGTGIVGGDKAYFNPATGAYTKVSTAMVEVGVFQSSVKNDSLAIVKIDIVG